MTLVHTIDPDYAYKLEDAVPELPSDCAVSIEDGHPQEMSSTRPSHRTISGSVTKS